MCQGYRWYELILIGIGRYTCAGRFGSLGYEEIDAETYAEWGIDYLSEILFSLFPGPDAEQLSPPEYDNCANEGQSGTPLVSFNRYAKMSRALNETGRPILYSMCNWGEDQPWNFATVRGNQSSNYNVADFDHL